MQKRASGMLSEIVRSLWAVALELALYFCRLIVDWWRGDKNTFSTGLLNFFASWTVIGCFVAVIWAATDGRPSTVQG